MKKKKVSILSLCVFFLPLSFLYFGCSSDNSTVTPPPPPPGGGTDGQIAFQTTNQQNVRTLWRVAAIQGGAIVNLTALLDVISILPGTHQGPITVSTDGKWYVFLSERFDSNSQGYAGLTIVNSGIQSAETIISGGQTIHGEGGQATNGGRTVVYVNDGGPHTRDLFVVHKQGNTWTTPQCITTQSPFVWNYWPVISKDSSKVIFDAGANSFPSTSICEVNLDGTGYREVISINTTPPGYTTSPAVHSPSYSPDGSVIFEAEWGGGERVWKLSTGNPVPALLNASYTNDNSPVVLPNGKIASLWLNAPGSSGLHLIKLMDSNGQNYVMLTSSSSPFTEVDDIGLGAGP